MTHRYPVRVALALGVLALLAWTAPSAALTVFVDSTADAPDALPGDGRCATAGNLCTLRAAIEEANAHAGSADRVGRVTLSLKDRRATLGIVGLKLTAKAQMPLGVGPFRVTVVFGGDAVGGDLASDAGACAAHVFTCAVDATGRRFKCS